MKNKKRILKIIIPAIAIVCSSIFIPWDILYVWASPLSDTIQKEVENSCNHGLDGIIVHINQPDNNKFYAAGWKNRENKIAADPHALFKIASISKLYIAVAATKLIDRQILSLDDTLAELLPDLTGRIENVEQITLKLMLQHRSGIPNYTDSPDYPWSDPIKDNRKTLDLILDKPADLITC